MNKWIKKLTAALCAAVLMCGMAVTAYAGGGEEWDGLDPVEPLPTETIDPGEGFPPFSAQDSNAPNFRDEPRRHHC